MIEIENGSFYCSICREQLTIYSEDKGKGFRARCSHCKKTLYYPACEKCEQATWKHDEEKCLVVQADKKGLRYCRKCKKEKALSDFNMNGGSISARCKICQAEYFKEWYRSRTAKESESSSNYSDVLDELFGET